MVVLFFAMAFLMPAENVAERSVMVYEEQKVVFNTLKEIHEWNDMELVGEFTEEHVFPDTMLYYTFVNPVTRLNIHASVHTVGYGDSTLVIWRNVTPIPLYLRLTGDKIAETTLPIMDEAIIHLKQFIEAKSVHNN